MRLMIGTALALGLGLTASVALADGDPAKGEKIFNRCKACHSVKADAPKTQGPHLHGLFGRKSGSDVGYKYSKAMSEANIIWSEETLDKYLTDPKADVPGNKMVFVGIKNENQRKDLIAYLKEATK